MSFRAEEALERLKQCAVEGRVAHAYLVAGPVVEAARDVVHPWLKELLGEEPEGHPDVHVVRPESKSRQIRVEQIRRLIGDLNLTSMFGGWKVGIIHEADRMMAPAANSFLKTLEEPSKKTLLVLLTEAPDRLLPTLVSRCLVLKLRGGIAEPLPEGVDELAAEVSAAPRELVEGYRFLNRLLVLLTSVQEGIQKESESRMKEAKEEGYSGDGLEEFEKAMKAQVESRYQGQRQRVLVALLERLYQGDARVVTLFNEAAEALGRNVPESLALERLFVRLFSKG